MPEHDYKSDSTDNIMRKGMLTQGNTKVFVSNRLEEQVLQSRKVRTKDEHGQSKSDLPSPAKISSQASDTAIADGKAPEIEEQSKENGIESGSGETFIPPQQQ